jgi:methionyl-tRNA formyltransferase
MKEFSLCVMSRKGLVVLRDLIRKGYTKQIDKVVIAHDNNMANDYYKEMYDTCNEAGIEVHDRTEKITICSLYCITIAWRWLIPLKENTRLIVFHDSLLPKYRGFSPLVNMLINKEPYVGVTALNASEEYDKGDIISQRRVSVSYPIKINDAIDLVTPLYSEIVCDIISKIINNEALSANPQNEDESSYSLWRDEEDYHINWNHSSEDILQFVYSVGFPFKGAYSKIGNTVVRILDVKTIPDVKIENRQPGKVIFMQNGMPVVVCGKGLLKITSALSEDGQTVIPMRKFRVRFE